VHGRARSSRPPRRPAVPGRPLRPFLQGGLRRPGRRLHLGDQRLPETLNKRESRGETAIEINCGDHRLRKHRREWSVALRHPRGRKARRRGGEPARQHNTNGSNFSATGARPRHRRPAMAPLREQPEGHLTSRSALWSPHALARSRSRLARRHLRLSPTEAAAGAARNPTILADVCEAVIAAIYLDGGFTAAFAFVERFLGAADRRDEGAAPGAEDRLAGMGAGPRPGTAGPTRWSRTSGPAMHCISPCWPGSARSPRQPPPVPRNAPPKPPAAAALLETLLGKQKSKA